jgi:hypothetical protein
MRGSFYTNRIAGISDRVIAPVTPTIWSLKSQPKLNSALSRRGTSKVRERVGRDRRPPFARNVPKLNRESPRAGGTQKSTSFALHGPAWAARTDFFSDAAYFGQSNEIKEFKKPSHPRGWLFVGRLRGLIYFPRAGGGQKFSLFEGRTGGLGAQTFSAICEIFFYVPLGGIKSLKVSIANQWARSKNFVAQLAEYFFRTAAAAFSRNFVAKFRVGGGRWPLTP